MWGNIASFPVRIVCWRPSITCLATKRNQIFNEHDGITILILVIDILHGLHLGVMQRIARTFLWRLIVASPWGVQGTEEETLAGCVLHIKDGLASWYSQQGEASWRGEGRGEEITVVSDLTLKMMGTRSIPQLKAKAMECWGIFLYVQNLVVSWGVRQEHGHA